MANGRGLALDSCRVRLFCVFVCWHDPKQVVYMRDMVLVLLFCVCVKCVCWHDPRNVVYLLKYIFLPCVPMIQCVWSLCVCVYVCWQDPRKVVYLLNYMLEVRRATSDKEEVRMAGHAHAAGGLAVCLFTIYFFCIFVL